MKVLVLCERVDGEGGTESYLRTLLPALHARGDAVRVIARSLAQADAYGVPAEAVEWSDEHDAPDDRAGVRVAATLAAFEPDVVAVHNVLDAAVLAAARRAPRVVYHLHDHRPFCPNGDRLYPQGAGICTVTMGRTACAFHGLVHGCAYGPRPRTLGLIARRRAVARQVAAADAVVALSQAMAHLARAHGSAPERVHVVMPPLADAAFADPPAARPAVDAVLFAGRIMPSKGLRALIAALARIAPAQRPRLDVAGEGPDLAEARVQARALGVALRPLGKLPADALRAAIDACSLVAVPSRWSEPYGLIGIEAFARGRPVVAFRVGGIADWIEGGGLAVARDDVAALADAIIALHTPQRWHAAAAAAYASADQFRGSAPIEALRAIYAGAER